MKNTLSMPRASFISKLTSVRAMFAASALFVCLFAASFTRAQEMTHTLDEQPSEQTPLPLLPLEGDDVVVHNSSAASTFGVGAPQTLVPTLVVTKTADTNDGVCNADCSLREAIDVADSNGVPDVIGFNIPAGDPNCGGNNCVITFTLGEIVPAADGGNLMTIDGSAQNVALDGNNATRLFLILTNRKVAMNNLLIRRGNGASAVAQSGFGGAIYVNGSGGPVAAQLTLTDVTLNNNSTNGEGGAINANLGSVLTMTNCTVSNNSASGSGGGLMLTDSGAKTLTNVTISGNQSGNNGGGIRNFAGSPLSATSLTVANNTAANRGGGIDGTGSPTTIRNSIVSNNTQAASPDIAGATLTSGGYNLIGKNNGSAAANFPAGNPNANNDIVGTIANPIDPQLLPLANNGGATRTHAITVNSPAVDKGNSFGTTTDQRGLLRPVDFLTIANATGGDGADIGAFEVQGADLSLTKTDSPDPVSAGALLTYTVTVTNNGASEATNVLMSDPLPANVTFDSIVSNTFDNCVAGGNPPTLTCDEASLAAGSSVQVVFRVRVNQGATGTVSNTAATFSSTPDTNPSNNSDTETTAIANEAALGGFTLVVSPDPVAPGANLTYQISLTNSGNIPAQNVVVTQSDFFPQSGSKRLEIVSIAAPAGFTCGKANPLTDPALAEVVCRGTLAAGQTAQFTIVKRQRTPLTKGRVINHEAEVTTDTFEANTTDNRATDTTTVQ